MTYRSAAQEVLGLFTVAFPVVGEGDTGKVGNPTGNIPVSAAAPTAAATVPFPFAPPIRPTAPTPGVATIADVGIVLLPPATRLYRLCVATKVLLSLLATSIVRLPATVDGVCSW